MPAGLTVVQRLDTLWFGANPIIRQALRQALSVVFVYCAILAIPAPILGDEADDQFTIAAGHYTRRNWKLAIEEFELYLKSSPNDERFDRGVFFLAESLLQTGRHQEAAARFHEYLQRKPNGQLARSALFRMAESKFLARDRKQAKIDLERFIEKHPNDRLNAFAMTYLGDVLLGDGNAERAEKLYRKCLARFPQGRMQDECRFGLARSLQQQDQLEEAERIFLAVASKRNALADDAQFHLGSLQYAMGRYDEVLKTFTPFDKRMANSSWRPMALLGRGWALLKLDRPEEAATQFQSLVDEPKIGIEARYWLGLTRKSQKQWHEAAKIFLDAAVDEPTHKMVPAMRCHAGTALFHANDLEAAEEQFDRVLTSGGKHEWVDDALEGKMKIALQKKDHATLEKQVTQFDRRHAKSPIREQIQWLLGRSLIERKEYQQAVNVMEPLVDAKTNRPKTLEGCYLMAVAFKGIARHEEALRLLAPLLEEKQEPLWADAMLAQSTTLIALDRFEEAIAPLEKYLHTNPTGNEAVQGRGQLAILNARTGRFGQAKTVYTKLLADHPKHDLMPSITEQLAEVVYQAGETQWAGQLFSRMKDSAPDAELRGLSGLAWSEYRQGHLEKAAALFDQLLEKKPQPEIDAEASLVRGQILVQLERPTEAMKMFNRVVDGYPQSQQFGQALWALGRLLDELDRNSEAIAVYAKLEKAKPEFADLDDVLYRWAWAEADQGATEKARKQFERIHKDYPKSTYWADATYRLAQMSFNSGDYSRAKELTASVLSAQPSDAVHENVLFLQGQVAAEEIRWEDVRDIFSELIRRNPKSPQAAFAEYRIAEADYRSGQIETAKKKFQQLLEQTKGQTEPWIGLIRLRLAQMACQQKEWAHAYEMANAIATLHPNFAEQYEADYVLGRALAAQADLEGARKAYQRVIKSPNAKKTERAAEANLMIAETYFHQKNYRNALRTYFQVVYLYAYPTFQAAALLQAGKCHELLGEKDEAIKAYQQLLKEFPLTDYAKQATKSLLMLGHRVETSTPTRSQKKRSKASGK